jgi:hypothetical protein
MLIIKPITPIMITPMPVTLDTFWYSSISGLLETIRTLRHCFKKLNIDSLFRFIKTPLKLVIKRRRDVKKSRLYKNRLLKYELIYLCMEKTDQTRDNAGGLKEDSTP